MNAGIARTRAHDLALDLLRRTARWPRRLRPGLTQRLEALTVDLGVQLAAAEVRRGRARRTRLLDADESVEGIRSLLRLANDLGLLSVGAHRHVAAQVDEIGRLVGGWLRSARSAGAS